MKKIIFLIISILTLFSCDKYLDIEPQQAIDADKALSTPENVKSTLAGAYLNARSRWLFGSQFNEYSELFAASGDLMNVGSNKEPQEIIEKELTITNSYVESTWRTGYETINILNTVLNSITIIDEDEQNKIEGEALFLRGWLYFEMVRLWGLPYETGQINLQPGVPLVINPTLTSQDAVKVTRATVEECYTQLIEDLNNARDLLPEKNGFLANSYAASAILARVYLQQGDFQKAAIEANRVIEDGGFELVSNIHNEFNNETNSSEDIFAFQNTLTSNTIWLTERYASLNGMGRGDYQILEVFFDNFEPNDIRGQIQFNTTSSYTYENIDSMYYIGVGPIRSGGINTFKWANYYACNPLIRLAEMHLIRAEANLELTAQVGPFTPTQDINIVRVRSQVTPMPAPVTKQQIKDERYRELCWEGFRLHDLKRWKENIGDYPYNAGNLILPIPASELEVNDLLEQNPYYN